MTNSHILILSDLNWHLDSKRINREDIFLLYETKVVGHGQRFYSVGTYFEIIKSQNPSLIIFSGDVTGDGSCGHGYHTAFYYLLSLLQIEGIPTLFIKGDNDLDEYYTAVVQNLSSLPLVTEISDSVVNIQGLRILGISYETTADKSALQAMLTEVKDQSFDLVVCHAQLKRRTALIDLKCKTLITGHFDHKLFEFSGKTFISLGNDSEVINYATIRIEQDGLKYSYNFYNPKRRLIITYRLNPSDSSEDLYINDVPVDIAEYESLKLPQSGYAKDKNALALSIKFLRGKTYKEALELMMKIKSGQTAMDKALITRHMKVNITAKHKLSKTMLVDYVGKEVWKYIK